MSWNICQIFVANCSFCQWVRVFLFNYEICFLTTFSKFSTVKNNILSFFLFFSILFASMFYIFGILISDKTEILRALFSNSKMECFIDYEWWMDNLTLVIFSTQKWEHSYFINMSNSCRDNNHKMWLNKDRSESKISCNWRKNQTTYFQHSLCVYSFTLLLSSDSVFRFGLVLRIVYVTLKFVLSIWNFQSICDS